MIDRGLEGDVAARMDAYRGNPQALMQRYAQNQELIDLLALQKLKSEKEAAAREMQLKMAQQQAAQGQPPTIKEQREQEVMGMTKEEIAQQMGGIAQQQQEAQQAAVQQLTQSGIASVPTPNMSQFAGGGIVAFAGEEGSLVTDETRQEPKFEELPLAGPDAEVRGNELSSALASVGRTERRIDPETGEAVTLGEYLRRREARQVARARARLQAAPAQPRPAAPPAPRREEGIAAVAPTEPRPAAPTAPAAPAAPAGITAALPPEIANLGKTARDTATSMMQVDPRARQLEEEKRIEERLGLKPEQRKVYEEGIANLRRMQEEEYSPEAMRERRLSAFLRGAGGRSSFGSVMGGASGSAELERQRAAAGRRKGAEDIQKKMEEVIGIERGATKEGIGAGQKAYEQGSLTQRQGVESGAGLYGGELKSRDAALDRAIEDRKIQVQREANAAMRDQNNFSRLQGTLQNVNRAITQTERDYMKIYMPQIDMLKMQLQAKGGKDKVIEGQLKQIMDEMNAVIENATADMRRQQNALESAMAGGVDTSGFTVRKKSQ